VTDQTNTNAHTGAMQQEAATITSFFRQRKIMARVIGGFNSPAMYVYRLEMASSQKFDALAGALDDLQRVLYSARIKSGQIDPRNPRHRVVCRASQQPLVLEINRPAPQVLKLSELQWQPQPFQALAGIAYNTRQGQPVIWDLADPGQPHALVAGVSGSGKSNLELALAVTLAQGASPAQLTMFVVDGGNSTLQFLAELRHTAAFVGDAEGALLTIANVVAIVMDRKRRSDTSAAHRVLLIVDELANLLAVMDKQQRDQLQRDLAAIAAEGRKFGVHLMACTQKPLADVTGSLTKSQLAVRFVGAMLSWQDAQTAADMPATGAERLAGNGDFLIKNGMLLQRFQAPLVAPIRGAVWAANRAWLGIDPAPIHAALASLAGERSAGGEQTAVTVAAIPPALLPVFQQFTQQDGSLRRGGVAAALRALYGAEAPASGKRYQVEYDRVMTWHSDYFTSLPDTSTTGRTPVLTGVAAGSEVKSDGQV
jgi:DNA segregation ATPase FtsK/SpoIIIE-like protein